jgi:GTPase SAR1 family protein
VAIIDTDERQLTLKFVYCGPPLAGKTTNLYKLHELVDANNRGRLMTLDGSQDRTLFFDLLPIFFRVSGLSVRLKVYTVPGEVVHRMTRRAVLRGVDGVVFVADSGSKQAPVNRVSFAELQENLQLIAEDDVDVPLVTQFNKRDVEEPLEALPFTDEPVETAVAFEGQGVLETFLALAELVWQSVEKTSDLQGRFSVSAADFRSELSQHIGNP